MRRTAPDWVHEVKFDGYRMQARHRPTARSSCSPAPGSTGPTNSSRSRTRSRKLQVDTALIDGEVVVEDENGVSDFSALQDALKTRQDELRLLRVRSDASRRRGPHRRAADRAQVRAAGLAEGPDRDGIVRFSEHFEDDGSEMLEHARAHGSRRHRLEAARRALSLRPQRRLAQDQVRGRTRNSSSSATRTPRT